LVPNVEPYSGFSPNGDGINDFWTIENASAYENIIVQVFSRWGKKVFEQKRYDSDDADRRWDGTSSAGNPLPSGTYYYIIDVREPGVSPLTGPITIVR
ncbi:MAG: gliding motility-associated C-terminal domain-containing protein, partial [Bacteroidales bacterium]